MNAEPAPGVNVIVVPPLTVNVVVGVIPTAAANCATDAPPAATLTVFVVLR
ncbi:MAG: hypothetical protein IPK42_24785 [Betaproteobacteria bacterium]|nr:hypothetical protein [Betaproteobacteria bacterium]